MNLEAHQYQKWCNHDLRAQQYHQCSSPPILCLSVLLGGWRQRGAPYWQNPAKTRPHGEILTMQKLTRGVEQKHTSEKMVINL